MFVKTEYKEIKLLFLARKTWIFEENVLVFQKGIQTDRPERNQQIVQSLWSQISCKSWPVTLLLWHQLTHYSQTDENLYWNTTEKEEKKCPFTVHQYGRS